MSRRTVWMGFLFALSAIVAACSAGPEPVETAQLVTPSPATADQTSEPSVPAAPTERPISPTVGDVEDVAAGPTPEPDMGAPLTECEALTPPDPGVEGRFGPLGGTPSDLTRALNDYGRANPETWGGWWRDLPSRAIAVGITGPIEPHRSAIAEIAAANGAAIGLVPVVYTAAELEALTRDAFFAIDAELDLGQQGFGGGGQDLRINRVRIIFSDPTPETLGVVAEALPSDAVCVDILTSPAAPAGPLRVAVDPADADSRVTCRGFTEPFPLGSLLDPVPATELDHPAARALRAAQTAELGEPLPDLDWVVLFVEENLAGFATIEGRHHYATFVVERGTWVLDRYNSGGRGCDPQAAQDDGLGRVALALNPENLPSPADRVVSLLATEAGCAAERQMGDALVGPEVIETPDSVIVAYAVIPPVDDECPGNPSTEVQVELAEPLGDRPILDGWSVPPEPVTAD